MANDFEIKQEIKHIYDSLLTFEPTIVYSLPVEEKGNNCSIINNVVSTPGSQEGNNSNQQTSNSGTTNFEKKSAKKKLIVNEELIVDCITDTETDITVSEEEEEYVPEVKRIRTLSCKQTQLIAESEISPCNTSSKKRPENSVRCTKRNKHNPSVKKQCCLFCGRKFSKLSKHIIRKHKKDPEVQKILKHDPGSPTRKNLLNLLTNKGNFTENLRILQSGSGNLILKKSTEEANITEFLPCRNCFAFYKRSNLWRHSKVCKQKGLSAKVEHKIIQKNGQEDKRLRTLGCKQTQLIAESKISPCNISSKEKPQISVRCTNRTKHNPSAKKQCCLFCGKKFSKLSKHILRKHKKDPEVQKILKHEPGSPTRKNLLNLLTNKGNFTENLRILQSGSGNLILKKSTEEANITEFLPCKNCFAFYKRSSLWRHSKICKQRGSSAKVEHKTHQKNGQLLIPCTKEVTPKLESKLFSTLKPDDITLCLKNDTSILQLAEHLFVKYNNHPHQHQYVLQRLRELARLLLEIRKTYHNVTFFEIIHPQWFDRILHTVQVLCKFSLDGVECRIPSLAIKLGHSVKQIADIIKCEASRNGDEDRINLINEFLRLFEKKWPNSISSVALSSVKNHKKDQQQLNLERGHVENLTGKSLGEMESNPHEKKKTRNWNAWSEEEVKAIMCSDISDFITRMTIPGKEACEKCLREGVFKNRKWQDIKNWARNKITTIQRKCVK